jgi:TolB-like protein/tetratricopeptide (TPR) repeat protein
MAAGSFLQELKRRNVIRMAGLYLVGAWLLVQVASTLFPAFNVPEGAMRALVIVLVLGFVVALVFAWIYELTPEGLKRDAEVPPEQSIGTQTGRRMDRIIIAVLALSLVYFALDKYVLAPHRVRTQAPAVAAATAAPVAAASVAGDNSIAVLPFVDMSQAKDQEYFSDGLSEELLNQLAQVPQLRVIARTSSFSFKGKEVPIAEIAKALNVAHVLEGSVRKSGNTLRITAQLIRTSDSSHLWSNTYDRTMDDVFKVQDEISREVVSALKLQLLPEKQPDNTQRTKNPEAYEQYLLGKEAARTGGRASVEAALAAFERAVALDPNYANAVAWVANLQGSMTDFQDTPAQREAMIDKALATATHAIELAPELPDGYVVRGSLRHRLRWDWQASGEDLARAIQIDPNRAATLRGYAAVLASLGRGQESVQVARKAAELDPLSDESWSLLGRVLIGQHEDAEARQALERAIVLNPQQNWANFLLGNLLLAQGDIDGATAHYQRAPDQFRTTGMAMAEFSRGRQEASNEALHKLESEYEIGFAYQIAQVYAWRGEKDKAFEWLDRCLELHDAGMQRLRYDTALDPLRSDPRFAALVVKMGFPK